MGKPIVPNPIKPILLKVLSPFRAHGKASNIQISSLRSIYYQNIFLHFLELNIKITGADCFTSYAFYGTVKPLLRILSDSAKNEDPPIVPRHIIFYNFS
jgi:hypothetical protein